jgi:predicted nucleic acid-binding Zn ribbon protein
MSRYRVYAKTIFELEVNNEDEIENIINNGFDLGELKITSVRKILHTKCGTCGTPIKSFQNKKYCSDKCRSAFNNQRYRIIKQNKEHKIEN